LSFFAKAQALKQDSVANNKEEVKQIGYATQPAWMVSGSISTVKGSELLNTFTTDLGNMLYGKISGLTVRQGGAEPGLDGSALSSRGLNTFGSGTGVLVVIDGFESSYNNLVPYEIESMTLLKDASATAMYGSLGANGVLLVTTKRGVAGKMKINFTAQKGFSSPTHLPKFMGSYDYATLFNEALVNDGKPEKYTVADLDAYKNRTDPYLHPDVNWYDEVLRKTVPISNYDLNFSGGDQSIRYYVLMNMVQADGLYMKSGDESSNSTNSTFTRFNFRSNVDINIGKRLLASVTVGGSVEEKQNPAANNTSGIFNNMASIPPNAFPVYNPNGTFSASLLYSNPLGDIMNKGFFTSNARTLQTTMSLTEQLDFITPGLSVKAAVSFNNYFTYFSNKSRDYRRFSLSLNINYLKKKSLYNKRWIVSFVKKRFQANQIL
jgi:TonB-dependent SusC/RagA subfamily outer membrane receptor